MFSYLSLFTSAFLAATILPFYSEALLVLMLMEGKSALWLFVAASSGNTLGACVNWLIGKNLRYVHKRWPFLLREERLESSERWFRRWGVWSLLFTWLPLIGDALTILAGIMRIHFWKFFILTLIGKSTRYIILIYLTKIAMATQ